MNAILKQSAQALQAKECECREEQFNVVETLIGELLMRMQALNPGDKTGWRPETERHAEGVLTKAIEDQTARLPSDTFLLAAGGAIVLSLALKISGKDHMALFVGQWVAPFLLLGVYNKIVKVAGSDRRSD